MKFITKAKVSAREGRDRELRMRQEDENRIPRQRSKFHINLPFHNASRRLGYRLKQLGVDLTFSNRNSLINRISHGEKRHCTGGVYIIECKNTDCKRVYVGQSQDIPKRLNEHRLAISQDNILYSTVTHSRLRGHGMNTSSGITAYESDSYSHRLVVETSLIYACNTIKGNKSTSSTRDIDRFAPKILQGAPLNWKDLARVQSSTFKPDAIPRKHLKLFRSSHNNHTSPSTNFSDSGPFPISIPHSSDDPHVSRHSYNLRSHRQLAS